MHSALSAAVERAAAWYRECHHWRVRVVEDAVLLPLERGVVGFVVPASRANRAREIAEISGIQSVALSEGGAAPRVTFLAEADESVFGQFQMPRDVRYLGVCSTVRLPLLDRLPGDRLSWISPPDPDSRWLPRAAAVLAAVSAATPFALRARRSPTRVPGGERLLIG